MNTIRKENDVLSIYTLAQVTKDWLNYHINTNKEYVISESSLKLPIADYLAQFPGSVELERGMLDFAKKRFDVYANINDREIFIELKYVQDKYTRYQKEQQRVFDDLLRLSSVAEDVGVECYFLICGPKKLFTTEFEELGVQCSALFNAAQGIGSGFSQKITSVYQNLFDFHTQKTKILDCNKAPLDEFFKSFKKSHKLSRIRKKLCKLHNEKQDSFYQELSKIKVKRIAYFNMNADISALGLWKVERA